VDTHHRTLVLDRTRANDDARTVPASVSSETPVDRHDYKEVLSHKAGAINLERMPLPVVEAHRSGEPPVGIFEQPKIAGGKLRGTVRFGESRRAQELFRDVKSGVVRNLSVGYSIDKHQMQPDGETLLATRWTPHEVSIVGAPADPSVGFGRALNTHSQGNQIMENEDENNTGDVVTLTRSQRAAARSAAALEREADARAVEAERDRIAEIKAMCRTYGIQDAVVRDLVDSGASIRQVRQTVSAIVQSKNTQRSTMQQDDPTEFDQFGGEIGLDGREVNNFSLIRAVNAMISGNWKNAGFERAACDAQAKKLGRPTAGFFIPADVMMRGAWQAKRAAYNTGATGTGGAVVASNLMAGAFIEALRNEARVMQAGATVLSGLVGNAVIPRQTSLTNTYWVAESTGVTEAEATFDQITLTPKTLGALSKMSRLMMIQSTPDIEMLVRSDLIQQIALGVDLAALSGAGSGGVPLGVVNASGVGSVVGGTNGAQVTFDHLLQMESALNAANAPTDTRAYLLNAKTIGWLKGLKATTGTYLWTTDAPGQRSGTPPNANGYDVLATNQLRSTLTKGTSAGICSELVLGAWSQLVIGEWGAFEIVANANDTTGFPAGDVLIRAMQSIDIGVRHVGAFAVMSDALTA
jgi:HK97 family phage major capsid protein